MQSPSRLSGASASSGSALAVSDLPGWEDLPDALLHSIVALLSSCRDLLAFACTCTSWRAAFSSYPSKSTLCDMLPPLLIRPSFRVQAPNPPPNNDRQMHTCKVVDPANRNSALHCQIPLEILHRMHFASSSYGHLIFYLNQHFLVIDVFTGAEVSPPRLPLGSHHKEFYYCCVLTAPLASPSSHLIVSTRSSLFDWPVGSDSWSELQLPHERIEQVVKFNGQFIAMDHDSRTYTLQLAPQLGLQMITIERLGNLIPDRHLRMKKPWLVVCSHMLLMVTLDRFYRLDVSINPAKLMEMELDNWALFAADNARIPLFSCVSSERWGGRSNSLYYSECLKPWSVHGLGDMTEPWRGHTAVCNRKWGNHLQSLWVYPSMLYSDGQ